MNEDRTEMRARLNAQNTQQAEAARMAVEERQRMTAKIAALGAAIGTIGESDSERQARLERRRAERDAMMARYDANRGATRRVRDGMMSHSVDMAGRMIDNNMRALAQADKDRQVRRQEVVETRVRYADEPRDKGLGL